MRSYKNKKASFFIVCAVSVMFGMCIMSDSAFATTYTMGMSTSGSVTVDVGNVGNGTSVGTDTLTVTSTCPSGYTVSISGPDDRNLYKDGDSSNNTAGSFIAPSAGTVSSPAIITGNNQGTWGYSLSSNTGVGTFIGLPSTQTALTTKNSASGVGGDTIPVYYGVSIASGHTSGNYKMADSGAITYYLTMSDDCVSYQLSFNANGGTGTMAAQRIYEGIATPVNSSTFTPPTGKAFDSWNTSADGSGITYTAGQSVTDISAVGTTLPLYAQWKDACTDANSICYFKNAPTNVVSGSMGEQSANANTSVNLLASNFSRAGYGFAGWNTKPDYTGTFYGPMETITTPNDMSTGLPLYAVWVESEGSLQDSTKVAQLCGTGTGSLTQAPIDGTANLSSVSALTDQRDNQTYAIAKLADGKCWMIENLRLDNTAELTTINTNNPLNDGTNVTLKHNYTDTDTHNTLSSTSAVAYNADTAPDGWCTTNSAACDDQSRLRTDNTANRATGNPNVNTGSMYSYGNYYNWYSATAGNGTYSYSTNNNSVGGDLCPAGWRLPKGGDKTRIESNADNEFWNLAVVALNNNTLPANYNSSTNLYYNGSAEAGPVDKALRTYPNNYLYSGYVYGGSLNYRGSRGTYWSSTAGSSSGAYYLSLASSDVYPGASGSHKFGGRAVRCVAQ